jgi:phosphate transport system protein
MVEQVTLSALEPLKRRDPEPSRGVIVGDRALNARRIAIEIARPSVIARYQPVAQDSPAPAAILEIITQQERSRNCAKGTAEITLRLEDQLLVKSLADVPRVAQKAADMLHRAHCPSGRGGSCGRATAPGGRRGGWAVQAGLP